MSKTELMHQLRHRLHTTMSHSRADYPGPMGRPSRGVSLRDVCHFLIGVLIGYVTLGW
jgi:hypothetical protein